MRARRTVRDVLSILNSFLQDVPADSFDGRAILAASSDAVGLLYWTNEEAANREAERILREVLSFLCRK